MYTSSPLTTPPGTGPPLFTASPPLACGTMGGKATLVATRALAHGSRGSVVRTWNGYPGGSSASAMDLPCSFALMNSASAAGVVAFGSSASRSARFCSDRFPHLGAAAQGVGSRMGVPFAEQAQRGEDTQRGRPGFCTRGSPAGRSFPCDWGACPPAGHGW